MEAMDAWGWAHSAPLGLRLGTIALHLSPSHGRKPGISSEQHRLAVSELLRRMPPAGRNFGGRADGRNDDRKLLPAYHLHTDFGKVELHLSAEDGFLVMLCIGISNFVWLFVTGALRTVSAGVSHYW